MLAMAPSFSERSGSGMMRSGSISSLLPRPWQSGQAPCGVLKEKVRGSISGRADAVLGAGQVLGEVDVLSASSWSHEVDGDVALAQLERGLDRIGQARAGGLLLLLVLRLAEMTRRSTTASMVCCL